MQTANAMLVGGRTVVSAAMPRSSKLKVSGGTQTDFQQSKFNAICRQLGDLINVFCVNYSLFLLFCRTNAKSTVS